MEWFAGLERNRLGWTELSWSELGAWSSGRRMVDVEVNVEFDLDLDLVADILYTGVWRREPTHTTASALKWDGGPDDGFSQD